MWSRRAWLAGVAAALAACSRPAAVRHGGAWVGAQHARGHRLRDTKSGSLPAPALKRRASVLVIGAGVAGLGCARALLRAGVDDVQVFDLEDSAGGNSRGHRIAGMACPLGAHYLPVPGPHATEVIDLLDDLGLRRSTPGGQPAYDERHLCHSPQERLFVDGHWHDGLLPPIEALPQGERAATLAQYRRFGEQVHALGRDHAFSIPTARSAWRPELDALDAVTFSRWLDAQQLDAPALRWYLDYCCRDDYGAGAGEVSAWAGLHYFASRHGFHAPGSDDGERDAVLTWPEGNAWLTGRMAAPLGERLHTAMVALRIGERRHEIDVDLWNERTQQLERWTAPSVVLATPLFVSLRLLERPPAALQAAASQMRHAPWLVANLHLDQALDDHPGAAPAWDNVVYGGAGLGYVDAMHQSTRPHPGPTVLSAYWSWGSDPASRRALLEGSWDEWSARVVASLTGPHPDLPEKLRQVDLMRYGHAMSIPLPGVRSSAALRALAEPQGRIAFAHSDLSGYSVFEEALFHGVRAARLRTHQ
ncbi:FAD-dependent oxidoreductase [Piscinibacter sp. XHJ-5]|uniref:flavin monoamine oxidase family protein n=1 Tax=Piscinibacter sp. XHJ-5 TaxID=3037797 RepID=UPI002452EBD2|nr:FAD-dependent oxidoreductase [Piscinibacter sp. XHJ-5]